MWSQHDPVWVALSVALSVGASVMALHLALLAKRAPSVWVRRLAIGTGALALGGGIWAMHFVGMLAYEVCAQGGFDLGLTAVSVLPSVAASGVALWLLSQVRASTGALWMGGMLMGAGVGSMHYVGMSASHLSPWIRYDLFGFVASLVLAVVLSTLAFWIRFGMQSAQRIQLALRTLSAGSVLGLAVAITHYVGMWAVRFVPAEASVYSPGMAATGQNSGTATLVWGIAGVVVALSLLVLAFNVGLRYRKMYEQMRASELRARAVLETAAGGIVLVDGDGIVQSFNRSAESILGWRASEVVGRNVRMLFASPAEDVIGQARRDAELLHERAKDSAVDQGREIDAVHKDGRDVPLRLAMGRVELPGKPLYVGFFSDISVRRRMEASLQRSEAQLRSLMSNIPGVTYRSRTDSRWTMLFLHGPVHSFTGWSPEDFVQGRVHLGEIIYPPDHARVRAQFDAALAEGQPYSIEYRLVHRDGSVHWVSDTGQALGHGEEPAQWVDGVILDITAAKAAQAEFEGLVAAVDRAIAVIEFDLDGRVLGANQNLLDMMGYTLEDIRGSHHDLFVDDAREGDMAFTTMWRRIVQGEVVVGEFVRYGKDGREVWLHASYNPIFNALGEPFKVVSFATDLSQRRAMEEVLRSAKERAEQAAAARSTFLANMSHEIRTPMNAIIGFTEALLHSPLNPTQQRHLQTVHHASRSMMRLLNDILDTARLDKGEVLLEVADFSLRGLCEQTLASLRIASDKKGLDLVLDYPGAGPDYVRGDAHRLQQVLVNLVGNAIKFTEQGAVTLRVDYVPGRVSLVVQDTGIGMTQAQIERIFDAFAQADASISRRFGGTGLGTTIARQLVERMGGRIEVQSTVGRGTVFAVDLPLPPGESPEAVPEQGVHLLPRLRVLAVDDVPHNLELIALTLERGQHEVLFAESGEQAVQFCASRRFDLVLMDLQMPGLDGLEATRRIRTHERAQGLPRTPIIALSASVLEGDRRAALAAGMDGFADKPVDEAHLYREMARVLGVHGAVPPGGAGGPRPTEPPDEGGAAAEPVGPVGPLPGAQSQEPPAVDWALGERRWGERDALLAALQRFLCGDRAVLRALQAAAHAGDAQALQVAAHRLRGVAANLALGPLQAALQELEGMAHPWDAQHVASSLSVVEQSWEAAVAAVQQVTWAEAPMVQAVARSAPSPAPAEDAPRAARLQAVQALEAALQRGEWPEDALDTLAQRWPSQTHHALHAAMADFDLDGALAQLAHLRAQLLPEPPPSAEGAGAPPAPG